MHDIDDAHDDTHACTEAYDSAAAAMGIWGATHPSAPGLGIGVAALGTHWAGQYFCNGGSIAPGSPPDYLDAKLGYDPEHEPAPALAPDPGVAAGPGPGGFDYGSDHDDVCSPSSSGFDYASDHDDVCAAGSGGFDYESISSAIPDDSGAFCPASCDSGASDADVSGSGGGSVETSSAGGNGS